jgi:hypothetical protein
MLPILLGAIMAVAHYYSEDFCVRCKEQYNSLLSFSAGISVTYLFLDLLPAFSDTAARTSKFLFLTILLSFILLHVVEKYIYKNAANDKIRRDLALEDSIVSFVYHFIIGMLLVTFTLQSWFTGILFFIPVLLYTMVSTLPVDAPRMQSAKIVLSLSTPLGALFSFFVYTRPTAIVTTALLGLVIGVLTYTVMRHSIPQGKKGEPLYFVLGVMMYSLLIISTWGVM